MVKKNIVLKESFEGGLKHSLYSNFKNWEEAFLELLDNAVSNRIMGKKLFVDIFTSPTFISIINKGGKGMGLKQLQEFLKWGIIKDREAHDLGAYSQGGKAAMGYLGNEMLVKASPAGGKILYTFKDDNLHDNKLKQYSVEQDNFDSEDGYVAIEVHKIKRKIKNEELKALVVDRYKPLVDNYEIEVRLNGELIHSQSFPLDETFKIQKFEFPLKFGDENYKKIKGWVGRLAPRSGVKGGMRCYKLGRLICDKEYFGHPDAHNKQTLNFLFGEVNLNHVPATTNKTDFDRDSDQWEEVRELMFGLLRPHIDDLLGREIQEPTDEEKDRVRTAKELVAELMKMKNKELQGSSLFEGFSQGQKPRTPSDLVDDQNSEEPKARRPNSPRTPPPVNAEGKRRRLKEFMDWEVRPMDENIRSIIEEVGSRKTLVVNNLFSGFKAAKGNNLYLLETAAIQLAKPEADEKLTAEEYIQNFDELYSFFCNNLDKAKEKLTEKNKVKVKA